MTIAIQCGVSADYFLDNMQEYELESLINAWENNYKNEWEQTRTIAYTTAQVNCTKKIQPTDILKFYWDNNRDDEEETNWGELKELREKIKDINQQNNGDRI